MLEIKIKLGFTKLEKALIALELMASKPMDEDRGNIDATIQRFEFTIELFWKLLKYILESKGALAQYPKDVLQEAYLGHLINDQQAWLQMLADRNLTSCTYDETLADTIYSHIKDYVPIMKETYEKLKKQFD